MAGRREGISLPRLRTAVDARMRATSRRRTASEIGLSPRGLWKFLEGATPHPATLDKLVRWYREVYEQGARGSPTDAIEVLLDPVPEAARQEARASLAGFVESLYARFGLSVPAELAEMRDDPEGESDRDGAPA